MMAGSPMKASPLFMLNMYNTCSTDSSQKAASLIGSHLDWTRSARIR